jgi:uncharacterized protein YeaO (DUF488 family)
LKGGRILFQLKRIYETATEQDGKRILIDRLWPRGLSKEKAQIDEWVKEVAPSHELRKWFHQHRDQYLDFKEMYIKELQREDRQNSILKLVKMSEQNTVTLLYATKDPVRNHAAVLKEFLEKQSEK